MRQLAIIVIMAQMGSYVSAESAQLPILMPSSLELVRQMTWYLDNQPLW